MISLRSRIYRFALSRSRLFDLELPDLRRKLLSGRARLPGQVRADDIVVAGVPSVRLVPARLQSSDVFIYLHGGGGCLGLAPATLAFASRLAEAAGAEVLVPDYRVAPEHPYPAAHDDAEALCRRMADDAKARGLVLLGDSFGFGLGLAALLAMPAPLRARFKAAVGFTPLVDMSGSSETLRSRRSRDPFRTRDPLRLARLYAHGADPNSPRLSPLRGSLGGLPPLIVQAAEDDVFLGDALTLAERATEAGVSVNLRVWSGMWHVFQLAAGLLPESTAALHQAVSLIPT